MAEKRIPETCSSDSNLVQCRHYLLPVIQTPLQSDWPLSSKQISTGQSELQNSQNTSDEEIILIRSASL